MKDVVKLYGKVKKVKIALKAAAFVAVAVATVYSLIPKYDKIEGVSEEGFLRNAECRMKNAE